MNVRALVACVVALACACSSTPEVTGSPWTFTPLKSTQRVGKMDVLFAIDNSASMGDKQDLLAAAIPSFIGRLLDPRCVDTDTSKSCTTASDCAALGANASCDTSRHNGQGQCFVPGDGKACTTNAATQPEFSPVHDLHVGIVSSSLGGGGSPDVCVVTGTDTTHVDDRGHLLNRPPVGKAKPIDGSGGDFLAWLPSSDPANAGAPSPNVIPYADGQTMPFVTDFASLVTGVDQHGCGLEAQLESWYRFLVQPDPYDQIVMSSDNPPRASLSGVDATLIAMRHDFLRPDSVVLILQVTDEEDSWSDPMWLGGYGWTARTATFPGGPGGGAGPRGTTECDQPDNPDCSSCAFPGSTKPVSGTAIGQDPNCNACPPSAPSCPQKGWYVPAASSVPIAAADGLNVRYASQTMRARYGFDNQHDVQRYIDGLRSASVPDRDNEAHPPNPYSTTKRNCTNPLYARDLPDGTDTSPGALCQLQAGARTPNQIFYALVGGVSRSLVEDGSGKPKIDLSADDWTKIVGKDPAHYVFDGIDPHMIESTAQRPGNAAPGSTYALGTDPENGRDWNTLTSADAIDLEYACTFDLPKPKDCNDTANQGACDCTGSASTAADGPPLCSPTARTTQIKGKAYPSIRELRVAQGLGAQAVVASACSKDVTSAVDAPTYGYNPAMDAIVRRLDVALGGDCLGPAISGDSCIMLVTFPAQTDQSACEVHGLSQPPASALAGFRAQFLASLGDAGANAPVPALCLLQRLPTCDSDVVGWCYETNTGGCAHEIAFAAQSPPPGTVVSLACTAITN